MKYIKAKWLKPHPQYAYFAGDTGEINAENAAKLIAGGHIIPLPDDEDIEENTLPEDLPGREKLFEAGFGSVENVREAGDSLSDLLTKAELKKLNNYLEENQ